MLGFRPGFNPKSPAVERHLAGEADGEQGTQDCTPISGGRLCREFSPLTHKNGCEAKRSTHGDLLSASPARQRSIAGSNRPFYASVEPCRLLLSTGKGVMTLSTEEITEKVRAAGSWIESLEAEISKVVVGQKGLVTRLLIGLLTK